MLTKYGCAGLLCSEPEFRKISRARTQMADFLALKKTDSILPEGSNLEECFEKRYGFHDAEKARTLRLKVAWMNGREAGISSGFQKSYGHKIQPRPSAY
jgi:hypothetical protein